MQNWSRACCAVTAILVGSVMPHAGVPHRLDRAQHLGRAYASFAAGNRTLPGPGLIWVASDDYERSRNCPGLLDCNESHLDHGEGGRKTARIVGLRKQSEAPGSGECSLSYPSIVKSATHISSQQPEHHR